jgi:hypothetical protein
VISELRGGQFAVLLTHSVLVQVVTFVLRPPRPAATTAPISAPCGSRTHLPCLAHMSGHVCQVREVCAGLIGTGEIRESGPRGALIGA